MTDTLSFSTWLSGATAPALRVARDRIQHARIQRPAERSAANALLKQIAQELAARGVYRRSTTRQYDPSFQPRRDQAPSTRAAH